MRSAKQQNSNFEAVFAEELVHLQSLNDHFGSVGQGWATKRTVSILCRFQNPKHSPQ